MGKGAIVFKHLSHMNLSSATQKEPNNHSGEFHLL